MDSLSMTVVARIRSDFPTKFGIPRQSGLVEALKASVIFEPEYRNPDALRGWRDFPTSGSSGSFPRRCGTAGLPPCARPPGRKHADGRVRHQSPFRPNPIGLSCVRLERVEQHPALGPVLLVSGADLMDGTPILDLKPYLPYADCRPEASCGFAGPDGGSCWRWNCRSACGRWYRRRSERHCWAY
ncbi:MAG: SAM-dependent methyltransferase [Intestinimonas sp.]